MSRLTAVVAPLAYGLHPDTTASHPLTKKLGLYTEAELEHYKHLKLFPIAKQQIVATLMEGLCARAGACPVHTGRGDGPVYSLENL